MAEDDYIVLVERRRPRTVRYLRAHPRTAKNPTLPQVMARIAFGEVARLARGARFTSDLPPAALLVREALRGARFGRTRRRPLWLQRLELRLAREYGVERALRIVEELERRLAP